MGFVALGNFHLNTAGQCGQLVQLPDANDDLQNFLAWGYGEQANPGAGAWIKTPDLRAEPYNVPLEATAVRFHVKAKTKTITWSTLNCIADIQVAMRGSMDEVVNEFIHSSCSMQGGAGQPGEEVNSAMIDVLLPEDGQVEVFHYPSIINSYANAYLIVYLSGYFAPPPQPEE